MHSCPKMTPACAPPSRRRRPRDEIQTIQGKSVSSPLTLGTSHEEEWVNWHLPAQRELGIEMPENASSNEGPRSSPIAQFIFKLRRVNVCHVRPPPSAELQRLRILIPVVQILA